MVSPTKKLDRQQAKKLIGEIVKKGHVAFTGHALREMAKDNMTVADVMNALRCGRIYEEGEFENTGYRYRVKTEKFAVVVEFRSESELVVVTAWRLKT